MNGTAEREKLHGYTVGALPVTQDAEMAIEHLFRCYPEWVLRASGQREAIGVAKQRLSKAVQAGDVEDICRVRVSLRNMLHLIERRFPSFTLPDGDDDAPVGRGAGVKLWSGGAN